MSFNIRLKTEMKIKLKLLRYIYIYNKTIKKTKIKKWQEHDKINKNENKKTNATH